MIIQDYEKRAKKGLTATKDAGKIRKVIKEREREIKKL
jgi:hypothetical protein